MKIFITNTKTKELAEYDEPGKFEGNEYIWTEGNYGCDCNRELFFLRALGREEPNCPPCGHGTYLLKIIDDGVTVLDETVPLIDLAFPDIKFFGPYEE